MAVVLDQIEVVRRREECRFLDCSSIQRPSAASSSCKVGREIGPGDHLFALRQGRQDAFQKPQRSKAKRTSRRS